MAITFAERAADMGLSVFEGSRGCYVYSDQYGSVVYRQLACQSNFPQHQHPTDELPVPLMGIFTQAPECTDYKYVGYVSPLYKFIGNDVLNQRIRNAILEVGMPIVNEHTILTADYTHMRNEIVIQNGQNIPQAGDVLPVMIVSNSYNGTRAASIAYGITLEYNQNSITFAFTLGEMRQVHIVSSTTSISSSINSYIQVFNENIADMITSSFSSRLSEEEMLGVLDVIEGYGKKRRDGVSSILDEIQEGSENPLPTAWQMFLAIVRYSSIEPNLNIKRMMESAAESVLVIPPRMLDVLERL